MLIRRMEFYRPDKTDKVIILLLILLFGGFFLFFPVLGYGDSYQHLTQSIAREPGYALFLKLFQTVFPEGIFQQAVGLVQNLLAAVSIWFVQKNLQKLFAFSSLFRVLAVLALMAPHIMTPLASSTGMVITCSILTEGITFSLFYIYMVYMLRVIYTAEVWSRNLSAAFLLAWLLSMIRGQMMVLMLVWGLAFGYVILMQKKFRLLLVCALAVAVGFAARTVLVRTYNYGFHGYFTDTTSGKPMLLANVLYVSEKEDADGILDKDIRHMFKEIMDRMEAGRMTVRYAKGSVLERALYHESVHDAINFDYLAPVIRQYIEDTTGINGSRFEECMMELDSYCTKMTQELLPQTAGRFLQNYFVIASLGFVRSIGVEQWGIPWLVLLLYVSAALLAGFLLWRDAKSRSAHFMVLVLIMICANVFSTSLMIQCISRYMIYNLPFFYLAGLTMVSEMWKGKRKDQLCGNAADRSR